MKKIELNIGLDILNSRLALHDIGLKACKAIDLILDEMKEPTLFILNLQDTDPLDYEFVNLAFSEIFKKYLNDPNLFIVFKCGEWELEEVFTGLAKILNLKKSTPISDKDLLVENKINLITINETNKPQFITAISEIHLEVLDGIENNQMTSSSLIQQKFNLNAEDTLRIINDLLKCKFIYKTEGPLYHSIISLI